MRTKRDWGWVARLPRTAARGIRTASGGSGQGSVTYGKLKVRAKVKR